MPWLKDIWILPDRMIKGNTPRAIRVICQLKAKAMARPTKIVVVF